MNKLLAHKEKKANNDENLLDDEDGTRICFFPFFLLCMLNRTYASKEMKRKKQQELKKMV